MKTYRSKISPGIVFFIVIVLGVSSYHMIGQSIWVGIAVNLLVGVFIAYMFATTYYVLSDSDLRIKCGFFSDLTIKIDSIRSVSETNNPLSSPAASLDRLAIEYGKFDTVMISPKHKIEFINHLLRINPKIELNLKSKRLLKEITKS